MTRFRSDIHHLHPHVSSFRMFTGPHSEQRGYMGNMVQVGVFPGRKASSTPLASLSELLCYNSVLPLLTSYMVD